MRKVRYSVAMSLDGFIAGPDGEYDWLPTDLDFDGGAFMARFDTVVMGRATWSGPRAAAAGACARTSSRGPWTRRRTRT